MGSILEAKVKGSAAEQVTANELVKLNQNLVEANKSSERLTEALNQITFWGVIIAGLGVFVAAVGLGFDVYQYIINN